MIEAKPKRYLLRATPEELGNRAEVPHEIEFLFKHKHLAILNGQLSTDFNAIEGKKKELEKRTSPEAL